MKIERIFTRGVVAISRRETLEEAAATMRRFHVGSLLVVEKTEARPEVVGIVTDRDLVLLAMAEGLNTHKLPVETIMTPVVASVPQSADTLEAITRMRAAGVRRLLVVDDANGDPCGIVSLDDILDGLAAELAGAAALFKEAAQREGGTVAAARAA